MRILDAFQRIRIPREDFQKRQLCGIASGAVMGFATSRSWEGALMGACAGINLVDPPSNMKTALASAIFSSTILGADWLQKIGAINFDSFLASPISQIFSQHSLSILTGLVFTFALEGTKAPIYLFPAAVALSTSHVSRLALLGFVGLNNFVRYHSFNSGIVTRPRDGLSRFSHRIHRHSSALVKLCNFFIPLSAGIAATNAIAQQNWVLRTWTLLLFAPVLDHFPMRTISSLAFSGWCLRTGLTERQGLINAVHWVAQAHILKNIGIGCSSLVLFGSSSGIGFAGSIIFKNGIASLPSRFKYLMPDMGVNVLSHVLSQMSTSYLYSGNVLCPKGLYYCYTAISCLGIVAGILFQRARENDLASRRRDRLDLLREREAQLRRRREELENALRLSQMELLRERAFFEEDGSGAKSSSSSVENSGPLVPQHLHDDEVLSKYMCPITGEPILHPVLDPTNGTTIYERSAIMRALRESRFSPTTRQPLSSFALIHLPALERFIESRIKDQSTINEELQAAAQEELARHKEAFRLKSNSGSSTAAAAAASL